MEEMKFNEFYQNWRGKLPELAESYIFDKGEIKGKITYCLFRGLIMDTNYDGKTFHIVYSDVPKKKHDLVQGKYEIDIPKEKTRIAVKIVDMLGEEVIVDKVI